jgi:hypothetical protein
MRDLVVALLTYFVEHSPYLLLACAFIGLLWLVRSVVHKLRLFVQHVTKEVREGKAELREFGGDLSDLRRELTTWKPGP